MSKLLIVLPTFSGHRLNYARLLRNGANEAGYRPVILPPPALVQAPELPLHISDLRPDELITASDFSLSSVNRVASHASAERVVFPDGDQYLTALLLQPPQRRTYAALVMRAPTLAQPFAVRSSLKWATIRLARRRRQNAIFTLVSSHSKHADGRDVVHDPVSLEISNAVRSRLVNRGIVPQKNWIAVLGAINARKNVDMVLESVRRAQLANAGVVLAGSIAPGYGAQIAQEVSRLKSDGTPVLLLEGHLTNAEIDAVVDLVDLVVLAHSNEGPSGIMAKALVAGTRVLAAGAHSLRRDCEGIPGTLWAPLQSSAMARAMRILMAQKGPDPQPGVDDFAGRLIGT